MTTDSRPAPRRFGWLVLDIAGTVMLALGLAAKFAPESAIAFGLDPGWAWPLIVAGGVAISVAMLLFVRNLRAPRRH